MVATILLVASAAVPAGPAAAQSDSEPSAAQRCFEHHKFGAQPVDVAKSADRQTVLAQVSWGYHDAIGCYLTLDDTALAALRSAPAPQSLPDAETEASEQCFEHHKFGQRPVDVAKSADRQTVLARLSWGHHPSIGCYLTLDDTALTTLRTAAQTDQAETSQPPASTGTIILDPAYGRVYCASRPDQTIDCWTPTGTHIDDPSGQFASIRHHAGTDIWCGAQADLAISCWEWDYQQVAGVWSLVVEPNDFYAQFADITSSQAQVSCGLRSDQSISCWDMVGLRDDAGNWVRDDEGNRVSVRKDLDVPSGTYTDIVERDEIWCGLRADQTITCWQWEVQSRLYAGDEYGDLVGLNAPDGQFASIKPYGGTDVWCGFRPDQTISCWEWERPTRYDGANPLLTLVEFTGPSGEYTDVTAVRFGYSDSVWCGLRADQTLSCWQGWDGHYPVLQWDDEGNVILTPLKLDVPSGTYIDITLSGSSWCGLRTDQSVLCWGWDEDGWGNPVLTPLKLNVPNGEYTNITAVAADTPNGFFNPGNWWCGWRADVVVSCWGYETQYDESGIAVRLPVEWDPPDGRFTDVFRPVEHDIWCGLRTDQTVACWPEDSVPSGWLSEEMSKGQIIDIAYDGESSWCVLRSDGELICASVRGPLLDGWG